MSRHVVEVQWSKAEDEDFVANHYSRAHVWNFDGGAQVPASSSPHVVPPPFSREANVDPEEAFVAALSSCHMLWFLSLAARQKFTVESYRDEATGIMGKNDEGKIAMTHVILKPLVKFSGDNQPEPSQVETLHQLAHDRCFIANSVKTQVSVDSSHLPR